MKPAEMMSCLQKAWQLDDKLVMQHYVCINAGESFTMTNRHSIPTLILEVQKYILVLCFVMINKKKIIYAIIGMPLSLLGFSRAFLHVH